MSNTEMSNFTFLTSLLVSQNQQLWDLGLSRSDMENEANVDAKIAELSAQFDFVILAEFFDEGLVILARLLCWELEDVSHKTYKIFDLKNYSGILTFCDQVRYLKQNARTASKVNNITLESREALTVIIILHFFIHCKN